MYKAFFGLTRNPFEITPDPRFFYGTARHNEALATLYHGIERRKGFIVVTGEVGTGKTLLARCLFQILKQQKISFAYVFNPLLPVLEFLHYACNDMGLSVRSQTKSEILIEMNRYLISQYRRNSTAALIIDEAQLLDWEMLEEIRLLTNLETAQQKLLQIVLIGQPELDEKLELQNLRQLKQRITLRCRLEPLSREETQKYIAVRLLMAGATGQQQIFPAPTVDLVHRYSQGIPRLVNTICEAALVSSFEMKSSMVVPELVEEVATDFRLVASSVREATSDTAAANVSSTKIRQIGAAGKTSQAAASV